MLLHRLARAAMPHDPTPPPLERGGAQEAHVAGLGDLGQRRAKVYAAVRGLREGRQRHARVRAPRQHAVPALGQGHTRAGNEIEIIRRQGRERAIEGLGSMSETVMERTVMFASAACCETLPTWGQPWSPAAMMPMRHW